MNRKRILTFLLSLILLCAASLPALAADDDVGLAYNVEIATFDSSGNTKNIFSVGETVVVKVILHNSGSRTAPVYALQGRLSYGSGLDYVSLESVGTAQHNSTREISFAAVDKAGIELTYPCELLTAIFTAAADGKPVFRLSEVIIANANATKRSVSVGADRQITVGTGVRAATEEALSDDILMAEALLQSAVVSDTEIPAYYPSFRVTPFVHGQLTQAVAAAKAALEQGTDLQTAMDALQTAVDNFTANKIYRYPPESTENIPVAIAWGQGGSACFASGDVASVKKGTSLTIQATPDSGHEVLSIYINGTRFPGQNSYTIARVDFATEVCVEFCLKPPFTDIAVGNWYYDAVRYAWAKGLVNGVSDTLFDPGRTTSRAMIVTILHRIEGQPDHAPDIAFSDVESGTWYTNAVLWAAENGIVNGMGDGRFAPNDPITREQLALMLYQYARYRGWDVSRTAGLSGYDDANKVSAWALDALQWAVATGLISGRTETTLVPQGTATRAETATILMRFMENIVE